ncbi:MAG: hypothetical protein R3E95_18935 [Thiolinea sp.]
MRKLLIWAAFLLISSAFSHPFQPLPKKAAMLISQQLQAVIKAAVKMEPPTDMA